jgi:hypothetical protein
MIISLSDLRTEDDQPITVNGTYFHPCYSFGSGLMVVRSFQKPRFFTSDTFIKLSGIGLQSGITLPVVNGKVVGLWADGAIPSKGLGQKCSSIS